MAHEFMTPPPRVTGYLPSRAGEEDDYDRGVNQVGDLVEALAVPGIGNAVVGDVGERHAQIGVAPAVRRADAAMPEGARAGQGAEAADVLRRAAQVGPQPAMHRHAHELVDPVAGVVADGVLQHARRDDPRTVEFAALQHHLVKCRHGARGAVAGAARRAALAPFGRVGIGVAPHSLTLALRDWLVHVGGAAELALRQADIEFARQPERLGHRLADDVAEVAARDRLDQHAERPVRRQPVIVHLGARRPFEREIAHHLVQPLVVGPGVLAHHRGREARLVSDGLQHRNGPL